MPFNKSFCLWLISFTGTHFSVDLNKGNTPCGLVSFPQHKAQFHGLRLYFFSLHVFSSIRMVRKSTLRT